MIHRGSRVTHFTSFVSNTTLRSIQRLISEPKQRYDIFIAIKDHAQETLLGVYLTSDLEVILYDVLSMGGEGTTSLSVMDVFGRAFISRSRYIILIHNHPKGDPH